jgi:hypothetical protein
MSNKGVKSRLGQDVKPGRPRGTFKNPYGVPVQEFYKILRKQNTQQKINDIKQRIILTKQPQQFNSGFEFQNRSKWVSPSCPGAKEETATIMSDTNRNEEGDQFHPRTKEKMASFLSDFHGSANDVKMGFMGDIGDY